MPRVSTDKTIQVPAELHEQIRKLAAKDAEAIGIPSMSMAVYLQRLVQPQLKKFTIK